MPVTRATYLQIECINDVRILRLCSGDAMNRLTEKLVTGMIEILHEFARDPHPLIITGNQNFFSAEPTWARLRP